jgi:hypothetical protein
MHKDTWQALITHPLSYIGRPCIALISFHFFSRRKKGKEREKLSPSAGRKPLGGKTSIVALLQASLHQEKDKLLLGLIFPTFRR